MPNHTSRFRHRTGGFGGRNARYNPAVPPFPPPTIFPPTGRWTPAARACVATVGNFDGVHVGHAAIVRRLVEMARRKGVPAVVVTFDPHPAQILRPDRVPPPLTTPARRAELLLALGVDAVFVQPVDAAVVAIAAEDFYGGLLRGRLAVQGLVEGADFHFGAGRRGTVTLLAELCRADGVELVTIEAVEHEGAAVSSSRLRRLIGAGCIAEANAILTAAYRCSGEVIRGAQRGRGLGFPTANLASLATLVPGPGVYACRATVADDARSWPAAVHVGPNVSFGETSLSVEAHLIGFDGDLYGSTLHVDFLDRLRETRRFESVADLTEQLARDVDRARAVAAAPVAESATDRSDHAT